MPRDVNGNYTKPLPDVVAGDVISSTWANSTIGDLETAMTDSLDRQGRGGMLAPFQFADGTMGAPSATFANEPTSGLYRAGAGDVRMTLQGVDLTRWNSGAFQVWNVDSWYSVLTTQTSGQVPTTANADDYLFWNGSQWAADALTALKVTFDNSTSGLTATTVQAAIDEVDGNLDTHIADASVHFTEASIDHGNIQNVGTNTHAQIDTHIGDGAVHYPVGSIDHTAIQNVGTNTHAQIDSHITTANAHIADASIHPPVVGFAGFRSLTQAEYDGITPDANTIYFIVG